MAKATATAPAPAPATATGETMTEQELSEIEARANAATPGPWDINRRYITLNGGDMGRVEYSALGPSVATDVQAMADGNFFAHAREDIPKLIAEMRRLRDIAIGGAELRITCPHCGKVSMTVCVGGKLR